MQTSINTDKNERTLRETSRITGYSITNLRNQISSGRIPAELKNGRWMIPAAEVERLRQRRIALFGEVR